MFERDERKRKVIRYRSLAKTAILVFVALMLISVNNSAVFAENYPTKPIQMIIHWPVGGTVDTGARTIAPYWEKYLGVKIELRNVTGGSGERGPTFVAKQAADGYTIGTNNCPQMNFLLSTRDTEFVIDSFDYIGCQQIDPNQLVVRADDSRFKSTSDFVNYAKKNPKLITAALPGIFGDDHLYLMEFLDAMEIDVSQVPFKGSGLCRTALLGGHVDCLLENTLTFFGFVGQGKPLKILIHFWPEKKLVEEGVIFAKAFPDKVAKFPLLNESGSYRGFFAPKGVPSDRLEILRETFKKAMNDPGFLADAKKRGVPVGYLSGPDWEDKIKQFQPVTDKMAKKYGKYVGGHEKK